jgi:hypothetical protein
MKQTSDEISIKDLLLNFGRFVKYVLEKWVLLLTMVILGAIIGLVYSLTQKPKYTGILTFAMEEGKTSSLAAYAGIASQFGIDLGGGGTGFFTGDNIQEFLKSRLMVEKTLLSPVEVDGKKESLAELYINTYDLRDRWKKDTAIGRVHFLVNQPRETYTRKQDSVLNLLFEDVTKRRLSVSRPDKKLNFMEVDVVSENEAFSKIFTETLVKEAVDFYVQTKVKHAKMNVDVLQEKADSIETLLNQKTYSVARSHDINLNPVRGVAQVETELLSRDKVMLQTIDAEVRKNLELAKLTMAQETPVIQIIDTPILPLKITKLGKIMGVLIGGFLAGFLVVFVLISSRLYRQIMK